MAEKHEVVVGSRALAIEACILLIIGLAIWLPRGFGLDRFVTTDEVAWLWRSANFYYALGQRNFAATDLNRSPGVVTMWVDAAAYLVKFPAYRGFGQGQLDKYAVLEAFLGEHGVSPHDILVTGRELMVLLNTALLALAFLFARRLFGWVTAIAGFLLIAFDPYDIALTRLAHLDGPLSSFLLLSLLSLLAFLYVGRQTGRNGARGRRLALILSGAAAGLAVLAKIPGFLMLPTAGLLLFSGAWFHRSLHQQEKISAMAGWLHNLVWPAMAWGIAFLLAIVLFFPAMWVQPVRSGVKLLLSPFGFAADVSQSRIRPAPGQSEGQGSALSGDGGVPGEGDSGDTEVLTGIASRPLDYFLRYPEKYLWRVTPPVLVGLILALGAYLAELRNARFRKTTGRPDDAHDQDGGDPLVSWNPFEQRLIRQSVAGILLFVLIYTVFMTIPPKSSSKYYLPVYPGLDLIAGAGWVGAANWVTQRIGARNQGPEERRHPLRRWVVPAAMVGVILVQAAQAFMVYPYYLTYLNPLTAGLAAHENPTMGSGEGLDQAGAYLNSKPDARKLKVMSWYGTGPFSYYFVGHTTSFFASNPTQVKIALSHLPEMDYLVVYSSQWGRRLPGELFDILDGVEPEKRIYLNGIEYVRIYNVKSLPTGKLTPLS